jgi:hypothetical protein
MTESAGQCIHHQSVTDSGVIVRRRPVADKDRAKMNAINACFSFHPPGGTGLFLYHIGT